jgi:hypothetical protein
VQRIGLSSSLSPGTGAVAESRDGEGAGLEAPPLSSGAAVAARLSAAGLLSSRSLLAPAGRTGEEALVSRLETLNN